MSDESPNSEKKIIVDEDWKSQVEAERETLSRPPEPPKAAEQDMQLPPANLTYLASTLYLQGAIAMGLLPHPGTEKTEIRLPLAKHAIDTLDVLQQKTEGNRTPDESEQIEAMLHQLRLAFVEVQAHAVQK